MFFSRSLNALLMPPAAEKYSQIACSKMPNASEFHQLLAVCKEKRKEVDQSIPACSVSVLSVLKLNSIFRNHDIEKI